MKRHLRVHYQGPLRWTSGGLHHASVGEFPVCCYGDRARKVAADGNQTRDPARVTCRNCLSILDHAGAKATAQEIDRAAQHNR